MKIRLSEAGKRFNREWIFRKANLQLNTAAAYAITGPNGSGKSTLLQCIGGMVQLSEGKIAYEDGNEGAVSEENVYRQISFCAPYLELVEEMTLLELLHFHRQFKPFITDFSEREIVTAIGLEKAAQKQIRFYSSGMKQRVKLAQAIFSNTSILLLDEPCTNLDADGIHLYQQLIDRYCKERLVIVCSNDPVEYQFCKEVLPMEAWKKS